MKQNNYIVLITGGGSGIRLALAKKFMEHDNTVTITGRNLYKLVKVQVEFPKIHINQSDVTNLNDVEAWRQTILILFPKGRYHLN
jgi:uncharacterized oxidoreductase